MRYLPFLLLAVGLLPTPALADPPPSLFYKDVAEARDFIAEGQYDKLLDVHLLQYSADEDWDLEWAANRYSKSGFFIESGSLTARDLYGAASLMLNAPLGGRLGFRYELRTFRDRRFDFTFHRMEGSAHLTERFAVVLAGWPDPRKEFSTMGAGFHFGGKHDDFYLRALYWDDRWVHASKRRDGLRFASQPVRYVLDGYLASGNWKYRGWANIGRTYRFEDEWNGMQTPGRGRGGYAEAAAEWSVRHWRAGVELKAAVKEAARGGDEAVGLYRRWGLGSLYGERDFGPWSAKLLVGATVQDDKFSLVEMGSAQFRGGLYDMQTYLASVEGGYAAGEHEYRLGYIAGVYGMDRQTKHPAFSVGARQGYADKLHAKWRFVFNEKFRTELLLSHELSDGRFGGASAKIFMLF